MEGCAASTPNLGRCVASGKATWGMGSSGCLPEQSPYLLTGQVEPLRGGSTRGEGRAGSFLMGRRGPELSPLGPDAKCLPGHRSPAWWGESGLTPPQLSTERADCLGPAELCPAPAKLSGPEVCRVVKSPRALQQKKVQSIFRNGGKCVKPQHAVTKLEINSGKDCPSGSEMERTSKGMQQAQHRETSKQVNTECKHGPRA